MSSSGSIPSSSFAGSSDAVKRDLKNLTEYRDQLYDHRDSTRAALEQLREEILTLPPTFNFSTKMFMRRHATSMERLYEDQEQLLDELYREMNTVSPNVSSAPASPVWVSIPSSSEADSPANAPAYAAYASYFTAYAPPSPVYTPTSPAYVAAPLEVENEASNAAVPEYLPLAEQNSKKRKVSLSLGFE